jgi:hypothetical protein
MVNLTDAQRAEAKNDLLLADIESRLEQIRAMRRYEDWRFVLQVAAIGGVIGVWIGFLLRH